MLTSLRGTTTRLAPRCARLLTVRPIDRNRETFEDAFAALGETLPERPPVPAPKSPPTTPDTFASILNIPPKSIPTSTRPPMMDIPPAEDPLLNFIVGCIVEHGHRARASRMVSRMLLHIHTLTRMAPIPIVREAIDRAAPAVKCVMHRQSAKNVAKPVALGEKQRVRTALKWIFEQSKSRPGSSFEQRLALEIVHIMMDDSKVLDMKVAEHRFAMVNRGNAKFRV